MNSKCHRRQGVKYSGQNKHERILNLKRQMDQEIASLKTPLIIPGISPGSRREDSFILSLANSLSSWEIVVWNWIRSENTAVIHGGFEKLFFTKNLSKIVWYFPCTLSIYFKCLWIVEKVYCSNSLFKHFYYYKIKYSHLILNIFLYVRFLNAAKYIIHSTKAT